MPERAIFEARAFRFLWLRHLSVGVASKDDLKLAILNRSKANFAHAIKSDQSNGSSIYHFIVLLDTLY